jgi:hypothetical protein
MRELALLPGKTIRVVIYKENSDPNRSPGGQLFLIFADGTSFEILTVARSYLSFGGGLLRGDPENVRSNMSNMKILFDSFRGGSS